MKICNIRQFCLALVSFAVVAVAYLASPTLPSANASDGMAGMTGCMNECKTCQTTCEKMLSKEKDKKSERAKLLGDCIAMCKTSHEFMTRGSAFHPKVCGLCSEICKKCAEACDTSKDKAAKDCADECRKCAASCDKMAG